MFPRGAWIPKKLPGLVLDFDMAMGVSKTGDNITYVVDQGEKGNNLEAVGTPKYVASAINGWPGVQCANGSYLRNTAGRLFDQNSARHVFAVLKPLSGAGGFASGGVVLSNPYTTTQTLNNSSPGLMFARATNNWASLEGPTSYGKYNAADITGSAHNFLLIRRCWPRDVEWIAPCYV